jgi:hypothetical protein
VVVVQLPGLRWLYDGFGHDLPVHFVAGVVRSNEPGIST